MASGQDLLNLAGNRWNPYFVAYAIDTGAADPDAARQRDGNNAPFMCWNMARWSETRKRLGLKSGEPACYRVSEHLDTLADHLGDKLDACLTQRAA